MRARALPRRHRTAGPRATVLLQLVLNLPSAPCTAFVAHVMGTCLASLAPISSWVGLEIGYVSALYTQLGGKWASLDPFVGLMQVSVPE